MASYVKNIRVIKATFVPNFFRTGENHKAHDDMDHAPDRPATVQANMAGIFLKVTTIMGCGEGYKKRNNDRERRTRTFSGRKALYGAPQPDVTDGI